MEKARKIVFSNEEIQAKIVEMGKQITKEYEGESILVVSLLKGSFIFTADLVRSIDVPVQIEFMTTSSYGDGEESTGKVNIVSDLNTNIEGRHVLIVDDIMDSGLTMQVIANHLKSFNPKTVKTCVLLDKPERRKVDMTPDYCGFVIPDLFIVGYGLNYGDFYRNIPYIFSFID